MAERSRSATHRSIRRHVIAGVGVVFLLAGGLGGWAATAEISGALIAPGALVVDTNVKKVQHPTGGVVGEVRAHEGDRVKAGDVLVRLDETITRANLAIISKGLIELYARKARLAAERDQADSVAIPKELSEQAESPEAAEALASERKLFDLRGAARSGQKAQLRQRAIQLREEIGGIEAQQKAKAREIVLINRELEGVNDLWEKKLVPLNRVMNLEREATRLEGERGQLIAAAAQAKGKVSEIELQIIQIDQDVSSEVANELRDIDSKIGELVERKLTAEDQLRRIDIRAPQDGLVFQSTVHTVGGVIAAGDAIMIIVPEADTLAAEIKVDPKDIDRLEVGQPAVLRFVSFDRSMTPEINGTVRRISADAAIDPRTGASFFTARISMTAAEIARLGKIKMTPGMPVEAFVNTGSRTVISYLVKPLHDQFKRALREE